MHAATQVGGVVSLRLYDGECELDAAYQNFGSDFDKRLKEKILVHRMYLYGLLAVRVMQR